MITYMSDILCITSRGLCQEDFLVRIEKIAKAQPIGIILREKDLSAKEYEALAKQVQAICEKYQTTCVLHQFADVAKKLKVKEIHLPLPVLRTLKEEERSFFSVLGASCHSVEEAIEAQELGCTYIIAGHVFETDCKKGLPGRGVEFLREICKNVFIPVYAIGGIHAGNVAEVRRAGASGACIMSGIMTCENPKEYLAGLQKDN